MLPDSCADLLQHYSATPGERKRSGQEWPAKTTTGSDRRGATLQHSLHLGYPSCAKRPQNRPNVSPFDWTQFNACSMSTTRLAPHCHTNPPSQQRFDPVGGMDLLCLALDPSMSEWELRERRAETGEHSPSAAHSKISFISHDDVLRLKLSTTHFSRRCGYFCKWEPSPQKRSSLEQSRLGGADTGDGDTCSSSCPGAAKQIVNLDQDEV